MSKTSITGLLKVTIGTVVASMHAAAMYMSAARSLQSLACNVDVWCIQHALAAYTVYMSGTHDMCDWLHLPNNGLLQLANQYQCSLVPFEGSC